MPMGLPPAMFPPLLPPTLERNAPSGAPALAAAGRHAPTSAKGAPRDGDKEYRAGGFQPNVGCDSDLTETTSLARLRAFEETSASAVMEFE